MRYLLPKFCDTCFFYRWDVQQVLEQMGFKKWREAVMQGTYFSVSLDRASSLKVNSQAGICPVQGREPALWLEVCVCVLQGAW